jgi:mRNA interferase YafQ
VAKAKPPPQQPPPLQVSTAAGFKRELKLCKKRGKDLEKLCVIIEELRHRRPLDPKHEDHALGSNWKDFRDCHIEPDWLLIYQVTGMELRLSRTGTHADLFGEKRRH